ncbi:hypothetical protein KJ763_01715 [Patescibacteria group bacterium]|nr:hypothetical protein [Patescibacteria group bacterium]
MSDNLEKLKGRLYRKEESFSERKKRAGLRIFNREKWTPPGDWTPSSEDGNKKLLPFTFPMKKIFIVAIILLLVSSAIVIFYVLKGFNIISSGNINLDIKGPVRINGGESVNLDFFIENKNSEAMETASLVIEFPNGSFTEKGNELGRERYALDKIEANSSYKKSVEFNLFGGENEEKLIKASLEYRLAGSSAIFAKESEYIIRINHPAVGVSMSLPKEINSKQEMEIIVNLVSNSDIVLKDMIVNINYPFGFQLIKAEPQPREKTSTWSLGDLGPSQQRKIILRGMIEGQDLEEKSFRAEAGILNKENIFIPYGSSAETVSIKRPYLDLAISLNGSEAENVIIYSGNYLKGEIIWKNNLTTIVSNASIEVKITGVALDEKSISISNGTYRTFDKTLVWNSSSMPELKVVNPGDTGKNSFSFAIISPLPINSSDDKNFTISIECSIKGKTVSESSGETDIFNNIKKEVKISSYLQLASQILHYSGVFNNTGSMPPKAGGETAYTVNWSIGNTSNDFSNVRIRGILPPYVRWLEQVSPSGETVSYDEKTGEVVWNVGNVQAGTGLLWPAKQVFFQISFMPSLSQVGTSPILISDVNMEGHDNFTSNIVQDKKQDLNTILSNDPQFKYTEGKVVK